MSNFTMDDVKAALQRVADDSEKFIKAQKGRFGEFTDKQGELQARLLQIEQMAARRGEPSDETYGGISSAVCAALNSSTELKDIADRRGKLAVIDMPNGYFQQYRVNAAITSTSGTGLALPDVRPELNAPRRRRLTIRSLLPSVPTLGGSVQYVRETGFTNAAANVSETTVKPESSATFELKTCPVVTIAHWIKLSLQVLSDTPQLQAYLDTLLRYGVSYAEELQLLKGSGVGNNLEGLYVAATAYSAPVSVPAPSKIDTIRLMIAQLELANYEATGIALHPADWAAIQLKKDTTGKYIFGDPNGSAPAQMWGIPVVPTAAMTVDTALVGDFGQAGLIFDREQNRVAISTETGTDFIENMCRARGEERLALGIVRPAALIKNADLPGT